jgi:hypothetical protein
MTALPPVSFRVSSKPISITQKAAVHTHNGQILLYLCGYFRNISTMRLRKGPPDLCSQIKDLEPCAASSHAALVHAALAD